MASCKRCGGETDLVYCVPCDRIVAEEDRRFYHWWEKESPYRQSRLRSAYRDVSRVAWMARAKIGDGR